MEEKEVLNQNLKVIKTAIEDGEVTVADILSLIKNNQQRQILQDLCEFDLVIDYSRSWQEMVDAGRYKWVNSGIVEKNFPLPSELISKKLPVSAKLFHFDNAICSKQAIDEIEQAGFRPATLAEQLSFGEIYPDLQKQIPIVALGSVYLSANIVHNVPVLIFADYARGLELCDFIYRWNTDYHFLAIRN